MIMGVVSTCVLLLLYPYLLRKTTESNILSIAIACNFIRLTRKSSSRVCIPFLPC